MPLTADQIKGLQSLHPEIRVIDWPKSMGWGTEQIKPIWEAYALAALDADDDDIIARIDSDVFFFNDRIFRAVARAECHFVGDGHFVNFKFCQGGCYFLRAKAVRGILDLLERHTWEELSKEIPVIVEDVMAQHLVNRAGLRTWMTWFMMFPDELRIAGELTKWQRWKFSCAHFVMKNKAFMLEAYEREILRHNLPEGYRIQVQRQFAVDAGADKGTV